MKISEKLKGLLTNGVFILMVVAVGYIIFLRECRSERYYVPKGKIVVNKSTWDSLNNRKIDTIFITTSDTIIIQKPVYIIKYKPAPTHENEGIEFTVDSITGEEIAIGEGIEHYKDSIVNDSIRIWDDLWVNGVIERWDRMYEPVIHTITKEVTISIPKIVTQNVYIGNNGLYISGLVGGNYNRFIYGASLDYITKKNNLYGIEYQRFGKENIYSFKIGAKLTIFQRKK